MHQRLSARWAQACDQGLCLECYLARVCSSETKLSKEKGDKWGAQCWKAEVLTS
jgi:hypothetical protein